MVKSPYRPTSDSYGDRCGMLVTVVFSCIKHEAITSLWALLEKPFDNLHFLQNISQKIQSLWEYLWGTILMARSGTFVYMRYASAVGLLPWEGEMGSSQTWCQHCDVTSESEKDSSGMKYLWLWREMATGVHSGNIFRWNLISQRWHRTYGNLGDDRAS